MGTQWKRYFCVLQNAIVRNEQPVWKLVSKATWLKKIVAVVCLTVCLRELGLVQRVNACMVRTARVVFAVVPPGCLINKLNSSFTEAQFNRHVLVFTHLVTYTIWQMTIIHVWLTN